MADRTPFYLANAYSAGWEHYLNTREDARMERVVDATTAVVKWGFLDLDHEAVQRWIRVALWG